jgi:hypothetical protein
MVNVSTIKVVKVRKGVGWKRILLDINRGNGGVKKGETWRTHGSIVFFCPSNCKKYRDQMKNKQSTKILLVRANPPLNILPA